MAVGHAVLTVVEVRSTPRKEKTGAWGTRHSRILELFGCPLDDLAERIGYRNIRNLRTLVRRPGPAEQWKSRSLTWLVWRSAEA
jgi:hypothetical protein